MTLDELRRLNGIITVLWPGQSWPDVTMVVVAPEFARLSYHHGELALRALLHDGERFAPVPAVVLHRGEQIEEAESLRRERLGSPDATRLPTPEERARAERWRAKLRANAERLAKSAPPRGAGMTRIDAALPSVAGGLDDLRDPDDE